MHPEADAFLDAIFAQPDDDTPRLVYADWLEEHGQANYAAFIRLQCAAARHKLWTPEANRLWEQIGDVWNRLSDEWWEATHPAWMEVNAEETETHHLDAVHFERGFLRNTVTLTLGQLVRFENTCWPWLPLPVTDVIVDGSEVVVQNWARLSRIRCLRIRNHQIDDDEQLWSLVGSPHLRNLEVLEINGQAVMGSDCINILIPERFPRLRELRMVVYDDEAERNQFRGYSPSSPPPSSLPAIQQRLAERFEKVVLTGRPY